MTTSPVSMLAAARERLALLLSFSLCLTLAACGGGGGGSNSSSQAAQASVTIGASAASVAAGGALTLTWSSANTGASSCTASGSWSGSVATSGSQQVTAPATSGTATYALTCGSASGSTAVTVTAPQNSVAVTVDNGPDGAKGQFNVPYVSVTVCRPGTTTCQTIDHVMVDTGSFGLRLMASKLDSTLGLPAVTSTSGALVGECTQFVSGYTWGAVLQADIKLGGETASGQSIQVIGQAPTTGVTAPDTCTNTGNNLGTIASLGANGILGVGLFQQDCGSACASRPVAGTYYACSGSTCTSTTMPLAQQVSNPVAAFTTDNNGVILTMPAVATGGATSLTGTLVFGIDTQTNNALGSTTRYTANGSGDFTTVYKGVRMTNSFIDSGSNGLFFNDSTIPTCSKSSDFFCPGGSISLSATTTGQNGTSGTIAFTIEDVDSLSGSTVAAWVGGPYSTLNDSSGNAFDFGLPFFFGRKVYVGMETNASGPYWAY